MKSNFNSPASPLDGSQTGATDPGQLSDWLALLAVILSALAILMMVVTQDTGAVTCQQTPAGQITPGELAE